MKENSLGFTRVDCCGNTGRGGDCDSISAPKGPAANAVAKFAADE